MFDVLYEPEPPAYYYGNPYVGDVPQPLYGWEWDPQRYCYVARTKPLTTTTTGTTIQVMAKEVIEYTENYALTSTSIAAVWYNENTQRMTVRFCHGGLYSYDDVSNDIFQELMDADSIGKHFAKVFKGTGPAGQETWPGAKHDENNVRFVNVDAAAAKEKEYKFVIHYVQESKHTTTIKAKDMAEAIAKFNAEPQDSEQPVRVTGVFIPVE